MAAHETTKERHYIRCHMELKMLESPCRHVASRLGGHRNRNGLALWTHNYNHSAGSPARTWRVPAMALHDLNPPRVALEAVCRNQSLDESSIFSCKHRLMFIENSASLECSHRNSHMQQCTRRGSRVQRDWRLSLMARDQASIADPSTSEVLLWCFDDAAVSQCQRG